MEGWFSHVLRDDWETSTRVVKADGIVLSTDESITSECILSMHCYPPDDCECVVPVVWSWFGGCLTKVGGWGWGLSCLRGGSWVWVIVSDAMEQCFCMMGLIWQGKLFRV